MGTSEILQSKRSEILNLAMGHGVKNLRVFGSVARGEAGPDSDVDFLVKMESGRSYLDIGAFLMDAQILLGRKVDVVTETGLHPYLRERVLKECRAV
ncbi:MAG TPA: nucleotidyltransferase family protein [bacterium]|nr:nucleotidyltransferase family protein [bacterium]